MNHKRGVLSLLSILLILGWVLMLIAPANAATQIDIVGPAGSGMFGTTVTVLPNGNFVVTDPYYDDGEIADVGAVYLYDGASAELISTLTGSRDGDLIGYGGVTVLTNGNYVIHSPLWYNGDVVGAGAITWGNSATGVSGVVSAANSLVGSTNEDNISSGGVMVLTNGNYVVSSPYWDNGGAVDAGAVTWGDGTTGVSGVVGAANSLVGTKDGDQVGNVHWGLPGVYVLSNGNYVVSSVFWDNGDAVDAGAVTWGDGTSGITGVVSAANSLVSSTAGDQVGWGGVYALSNGNYVVKSPEWDNGESTKAGAVTWGDGVSGTTGEVSAANSLVGSTADDQVGLGGMTALINGNYVVSSYQWNNGGASGAGAVTWGDGVSGTTGEVSAANSLVGSTADDHVGIWVTALANGHYLVRSPYWDNGAATDAGAVTWGDGSSGITGTVSAANSLVGSTTGDQIGIREVTELTNGNYVVPSPYWDNGTAVDIGAVTWCDGTTGTSGVIDPANSLVGSTTDDHVGYGGVTALSNGNYVVSSPWWDDGVGAVTWGDGTSSITGTVSIANSLVGSTFIDRVGLGGVTALANGNYVVSSTHANVGGAQTGAVTWGDGTSGITGIVSAANSLVGSTFIDWVGSVTALTNGNYVVSSPFWDNAGIVNAGAVTWGDGTIGVTGAVSDTNSLVGSTAYDWVGRGDDDGIGGVTVLANSNYVVFSPDWDNAGIVNAGAVSWGDGTHISNGIVDADNSVMGTTAAGGEYLNFEYDDVNVQLVVGRPYDNIITLFRPNLVPVADAGPDQSILSHAIVTLDGSASYDPDGNLPLAFDWEQSGGTPVSLNDSDTANPTFTAPTVLETSSLTFTLVVSDALGLASLPDEVVITVDPVPVADAGPDQSVLSGASVTLDGSASYDPYGYLPLGFSWEQSGGTPVTLSGSDTANPTFTAPTILETSTLTFTLVVSNSLGALSLPDEVVITVEPYAALLPMVVK